MKMKTLSILALRALLLIAICCGMLPVSFGQKQESAKSKNMAVILEKSSNKLVSTEISNQENKIACQNWWLYSIDEKINTTPAKLACEEVKDLTQLPEIVWNAITSKQKVYRTYISENHCGKKFNFVAKSDTKIIVVPATPAACSEPEQPCANNCTVENGYQRYRIVYDFQTQSICMQKRTCNGKEWKSLKTNNLRPGVNSFIHLDVINYNPIRDNLSLKYNFENLNLEGSQELIAALTRTSGAAKETNEVSEEENPTSENETDPDSLYSTDICDKLRQIIATNLDLPSDLKFDEPTTYNTIAESWKNATQGDLYSFATNEFDDSNVSCTQELIYSLKTFHENVKKLITLQQAYELNELSAAFAKELEDAKAALVAPDRNVLKDKLDKMIEEKTLLAKEKARSKASWENLATKITGKLEQIGVNDKEALKKLGENGKSMDQAYDRMTNYTTTTFAPIQMQDYDRINLTFMSNDKPLNPTSYKFYSKGGWKIDFSAGFSVNGLNSTTYYYESIRTETIGTDDDGNDITAKYGKIKSKVEAPDWGIAMLAHLYPRFGGIFQPAFAFGAQVDNDNVSFLVGGSLLLGREQRLGLSGGIALGSSLGLQPGYEIGQEVRDDNATQGGSVNVGGEARAQSCFFSLSYNLGGVK